MSLVGGASRALELRRRCRPVVGWHRRFTDSIGITFNRVTKNLPTIANRRTSGAPNSGARSALPYEIMDLPAALKFPVVLRHIEVTLGSQSATRWAIGWVCRSAFARHPAGAGAKREATDKDRDFWEVNE